MLNPDFAEFFHQHQFAVGISLDGPPPLHNQNRISPGGIGSYEGALKGYRLLRKAGVKPGIVCVIDPVSPPQPEKLLDWLSEIGAESVSLNPLFARRMERHGNYPNFLTSLQEVVEQLRSNIRFRELIMAGTTVEDRERMGLLDACHPGWSCYETISTLDEQGYIYFGCDRFMDGDLDGTKEFYRLGHIENGGFREALTSRRFMQLSALADRQKKVCASACNLYSTCDGGCIADWTLSQDKRAGKRPDVVMCQAVRTLTDARSKRIPIY